MPSNFSFNASMSHQIFLITDPRQQIRAKEGRLRLAMLASDTEVLDELISPNFIFTNQFGQLFSKEDELGLHRSGVLAFHALEPSEPDLRGDDQCIVVSVRMKVSGKICLPSTSARATMPHDAVIFMSTCDFILGGFLLLVDVACFARERFLRRWVLDFLCTVHDVLLQRIRTSCVHWSTGDGTPGA